VKKRKKIPTFKDEAAEREFWSREDSTQYVEWSRARTIRLVDLKPTLRRISLRLPEAMLAQLKALASERGVTYQSLLRVFLDQRIRAELSGQRMAEEVELLTDVRTALAQIDSGQGSSNSKARTDLRRGLAR
jgi:predicted DNA binding CopG/RHH family protein